MARWMRLGFWKALVVGILYPSVGTAFKLDWRGTEHVPREGGVILVTNHISYADPFGFARFVYNSGRFPSFLAKDGLFRIPVIGWVLRRVGQIPVHRGTADARVSLRDAIAAVQAGACVCIYPEGTVTRDPDWWPMVGKTGVARLALATNAPVIPVAQWGAQLAHDFHRKKLDLFPRKTLHALAGPAVDLSAYRDRPMTAELLREVTDLTMRSVRDLLGELREETPPEKFAPRPDRTTR